MSRSGVTTDIQAELQDYLKEKDLHALFVSIVEGILIDKPKNAIGFMVKYLMNKYPEETKEFKKVPAVETPEEHLPAVILCNISKDKEDDSVSEDESESSQQRIIPRNTRSSFVSTQRRASICAEKMCPSTLAESQVRCFPKSAEESTHIQGILNKNVIFQHLDEIQRKNVEDAMVLVERKRDDVIIKQGDDGDNFYILDDGAVDVFIGCDDNNSSQFGRLVKSYGVGDSFGELAIMYNAPRAATCVATSDVRLWVLDRTSYKIILMKTTISKREAHKGFLQRVSILSQLTEYEVLTISDALVEELFDDGAIVCEQGQVGDKFYMIKEGGSAVCSQIDVNGISHEVAHLSTGAYFGEIALVTSKTRQATVTASGCLTCLTLDRALFKRLMGPLQDILMRNIEEYNKFQAANI
mmetsp:Transcript_31299/g.38086  ORF Transcript_31299/g.38086 Transcript_31299/m.38086 type:complete len:412 (+) Transcript_31299:70-1305(+)